MEAQLSDRDERGTAACPRDEGGGGERARSEGRVRRFPRRLRGVQGRRTTSGSAEIERKLSADVVTEEKVARISDALDGQKRMLDRLVLKGRRPELGASTGAGRALEASEHKAAFDAYVRTGEMGGLKRLEAKAVSTGHDARQRLPGAAGDGSGDRPAARDRLADPRHRRHPHRVVQRLPQAVRDDRLRDRLGGRDRRARRRPTRRRWSSSNIR